MNEPGCCFIFVLGIDFKISYKYILIIYRLRKFKNIDRLRLRK